MRKRLHFILSIAIALTIATVIVAFSGKGFLQRIELSSSDLLFQLREPIEVNPKLVVIEIDDENIFKIGRWPWKRTWHAAIIEALNHFGAKYIYFDILFSEYSKDDVIFQKALSKAGNVYLPFAYRGRVFKRSNMLYPIDDFANEMKGTGSINIYPDVDGVLRKVPLFFIEGDRIKFNLGLQMAMDYLGMQVERISNEHLTISDGLDRIEIPLINKREMIINWAGKWKKTFHHFSFLDVLSAYRKSLKNEFYEMNLSPIKDSVCVVAVTAMGLYDIKPVPLAPEYPGVGATMNIFNNIVERQFLTVVPKWVNWLFIYILALLPPLLISEERPLREILSIFSVVGVIFFGEFLFNKGVQVDVSLPLLSLFASYIAVGTYNFARISMERRSYLALAITDGLTGLYNKRHFSMLLKTEVMMAKADPAHIFSILMIDIDNFKQFNDKYGHQVGDLVLEQVSKVLKISVKGSDVVARYGGEEIVIILRGTTLDNALIVAEKLRQNIENHVLREKDHLYSVTISIGVSYFVEKDDEKSVISRADKALYKAKWLGRNRVEFGEEEQE